MSQPVSDPIETGTAEGKPGKDPSNTPIEELLAPLPEDDDASQRLQGILAPDAEPRTTDSDAS